MYPMLQALTPSDIFFAHIVATLRRANDRYRRIAHVMRNTIQPTYRARHRAQKLGLGVDIQKAINCPQRAISLVPLPSLDTSVNHSYRIGTSISSSTPVGRTIPAIALSSSSNCLQLLSPFVRTPFSIHSYIHNGTPDPSQILSSKFSVSPASPVTSIPDVCDSILTQLQTRVDCEWLGDLNDLNMPRCHAEYHGSPIDDDGNSDIDWSPSSSRSSPLSSMFSSNKPHSIQLHVNALRQPAKRKFAGPEIDRISCPKHQLKKRWRANVITKDTSLQTKWPSDHPTTF